MEKTGNPYGTAAIMGNLMAESSLSPICATNMSKAGFSNISQYVKASDSLQHDFANDGVAFGIAQWCYRTRKRDLLNFAWNHGTSIGDLDTQLEYMWQELQEYKTALNAVLHATNIREAAEVVMLKYEKPANTSETMKQRRANYGQKYYDQFAAVKIAEETTPVRPAEGRKLVLATANVNIRLGNSKTYAKIGVLKKGKSLPWVATSENGWHAVEYESAVYWVSGEFAHVVVPVKSK